LQTTTSPNDKKIRLAWRVDVLEANGAAHVKFKTQKKLNKISTVKREQIRKLTFKLCTTF